MEIETMAFIRFKGSVNAISIELTRLDTRDPDMPDVSSAVARRIQIDDPDRLCVFDMREQLKSNAGGVTTE